MGEKFTKQNELFWDKIVDEYIKTRKLKEIADRIGYTTTAILYQVKKRNINLGKTQYYRKRNLNQNYFENIDTEAKAYILGFLMADGCVTNSIKGRKVNRLYINLSTKDRSVLEFIKEELETEAIIQDYIPKGTYAKHSMSKLIINSIKICSDLELYGITPAKTGYETIPYNIPNNMVRHFMRGFFDGDGSIFKRKQDSKIYHTISFTCASKIMLKEIKNVFNSILSLKSVCSITEESRGKNAYDMRIHCAEDIVKIRDYFYNDSHCYLNRKFKIFPA